MQPNTPTQPPESESARRHVKLFIILAVVITLCIVAFAVTRHKTTTSPEVKHAASNEQQESQANQQEAQDDQRNNQRKNDVASIASAISEFSNNNMGNIPTKIEVATNNTAVFCGDDCASQEKSAAKLSYYKPADIIFREASANVAVLDADTVYIVRQASCNQSKDGLSSDETASSRVVAILYAITSQSKPLQKCLNV